MQPFEVVSHRFYTSRHALFDSEEEFDRQLDTMDDRKEGIPPRDNRNED